MDLKYVSKWKETAHLASDWCVQVNPTVNKNKRAKED